MLELELELLGDCVELIPLWLLSVLWVEDGEVLDATVSPVDVEEPVELEVDP